MDREDDAEVEIQTVTRKGAVERFGKYRNLGRIGQGGMAEVFLAVGRGPAGFNKLVVIKRLRDTVASDDAFRDMFLDEARLAARLNHPNVVQTYEVFEDAGAFFITMEYLEGQPLGRIIRYCAKHGVGLDPGVCARIVSDVLCGLHYAHDACDFDGSALHIVHRDVSPQNIFVTYDGQVKVVDFGIAKAERSSTKTQAGFFKGKAAYMAPEQLEGAVIDRRVDVFTAGIVLWELLVGKKLMAAETTAKTLLRLIKEPIPRVTDVVASIDPELAAIVARALERDPAVRYQTAGEMRDALERYLVHCHQFVRQEDIGRLIGEVFSEARVERQRMVGEQMALSSVFPPSGTTPAAGASASQEGMPRSMDAPQLASMSGISVSRTVSSFIPAQPATTGLVAVERAPTFRLPPIAAAAMAAISVAVVFALVGRTHLGSTSAPPPAATAVPVPAATQLGAQQPFPSAPAIAPTPELARAEPPPPQPVPSASASPAPSPRAVPASQPAGRFRAQAVEPRQAIQPTRASANSPPAAASIASPASSPDAEAVRPAPPAPVAQPASPTPTQEGRKFRTSL